MIFRVRHLECPRCETTFRLRCRLTGDSELVPDCPECGWQLAMESIDHGGRSTFPAESGLWTRTTAAENGPEVRRTLDPANVIDIE